MNRILFEPEEITDGVAEFSGARAEHALRILHAGVGTVIKTGCLDGKAGCSVIEEIYDSPYPRIRARVDHTEESPRPWIDLVLAPPRPRAFKRLLPQLASLGVGRIFLVGAAKVEKDFWGASVLKEENYRPLLVDGLMQCSATTVPVLEMRRNFRRFLRDEAEHLFRDSARIVAHPSAAPTRHDPTVDGKIVTLAIGPEGGWTDEEVERLERLGFSRYSLGPRILRTDTATIALIARLMPR